MLLEVFWCYLPRTTTLSPKTVFYCHGTNILGIAFIDTSWFYWFCDFTATPHQYNTIQHLHITYLPYNIFTPVILPKIQYCLWNNVVCWFFWGPIHYDASHCMSVEASDFSAIILRNMEHRNMETPLGPLSSFYNLPLWFVGLYMSELSYSVCINIKWDFSIRILECFEKISWNHHHSKQHSVQDFSTNPPSPHWRSSYIFFFPNISVFMQSQIQYHKNQVNYSKVSTGAFTNNCSFRSSR